MILTLQNILDLGVLGHVIVPHGLTDTERALPRSLVKHNVLPGCWLVTQRALKAALV